MKIFKILFFALIIPLHLFANDVSLDDLDKVLQKAGSLNAFLADKSLQEKYYELAKEYYGPNFTNHGREQSYWVILDQMREAVKKNPVLGERLWSTQDLGTPFHIDASVKDFGLNFQSEKYHNAWIKYANSENMKAPEILVEEKGKLVQEVSDWITKKQEKIQIQLQSPELGKAKKASLQGKLYVDMQKELMQQKSYQTLQKIFISDLVHNETLVDAIKSGDANIIVDVLEKIRSQKMNPFALEGFEKQVAMIYPFFIRNSPAGLIRPRLPARSVNVKTNKATASGFFTTRTKVVKVRNEQGVVVREKLIPDSVMRGLDFKPVPRRFHAAFKGIELGECVAGGSCESISIDRWATPALEGSHHYYIEGSGNYKGWTSLYPGLASGEKVANIEFGASVLNSRQEFQGNSYPLSEFAMKQLESHMPKDTTAFLVGDSHAINNAGVIGEVQKSYSYGLGKDVGLDFTHKDQSTLDFLIGEQKTKKHSPYGYSKKGKGIIDAGQSMHANTILSRDYILNQNFSEQNIQELIQKIDAGDSKAINFLLTTESELATRPEMQNAFSRALKKDKGLTFSEPIVSWLTAKKNEAYLKSPRMEEAVVHTIASGNDKLLHHLMGLHSEGHDEYIKRPKVQAAIIESAKNGNDYAFRYIFEQRQYQNIHKEVLVSAIEKGGFFASQKYFEHPDFISLVEAEKAFTRSLYNGGVRASRFFENKKDLSPTVLEGLGFRLIESDDVVARAILTKEENLLKPKVLGYLAKYRDSLADADEHGMVSRHVGGKLVKMSAEGGIHGFDHILSEEYVKLLIAQNLDKPEVLEFAKKVLNYNSHAFIPHLLSQPANIDRPGVLESLLEASKNNFNAKSVLTRPHIILRANVLQTFLDQEEAYAKKRKAGLEFSLGENSINLLIEHSDRADIFDALKRIYKNGDYKAREKILPFLLQPENLRRADVREVLKSGPYYHRELIETSLLALPEELEKSGTLNILYEKYDFFKGHKWNNSSFKSAFSFVASHLDHPEVLDFLQNKFIEHDVQRMLLKELLKKENLANPKLFPLALKWVQEYRALEYIYTKDLDPKVAATIEAAKKITAQDKASKYLAKNMGRLHKEFSGQGIVRKALDSCRKISSALTALIN